MPYTQEQLQEASARFRNVLSGHMPDAIAIQISLDHLAEADAVNRDLRDELTGELIVGEPFTVYEGTGTRVVNYRNRYSGRMCPMWQRYDVGPHHFADESTARLAGWIECEHCGEWFHPDHSDERERVDGMWFCSADCATEYGYYTCENCGERVHEDNATIAGDCVYCGDYCARSAGWDYCDRCDEWTRDGRTVYNGGDAETWCESCREYSASWCDECQEYHHEDDMEYDADEDRYICEDCREGGSYCHHGRRRASGAELHSYGWTPILRYYSIEELDIFAAKQPLFLGVELETDGGGDRAEYVDRLAGIEGFLDRFWMTEDSSLRNGVEITSHPMTLSFHMNIAFMYGAIGEAAAEFGYKSHDGGRCGLHVHVSRRFFGKDKRLQDAAAYKMMRLMQRFEQAFTIFSRRQDNHWCSYKTSCSGDYKLDDTPKVNRNFKNEEGVLQAAHRMERNEKAHAQCLNFEHGETFEFRIFRGTLKWSTYFASLALVNGLCNTVRKHGSTWVESVTWLDLMEEVVANVDDDTARMCLVNYLNSKGLR